MGGKHRAPTNTKKNMARLCTVGVVATVPIAMTTPAFASTSDTLEVIAKCESGNQNVNTRGGSTASGYLQILDSTWRAFGGHEFASRAIHASRTEQFIVGQRILQGQGITAWNPSRSCWGGKVSRGETTTDNPKPKPVKKPKTKKKPTPVRTQSEAKRYVIQRGDTLTRIARRHGTTVSALVAANSDTVKNPDRIYVGNTLRLR